MTMPVHDLRGPHSDEACHILSKSVSLSYDQARHMGECYEADNNPNYSQYCCEVWDALERTNRILPLGWFEAIFAETSWVESTKALHAIADAVMATLVRSEVSREAFGCLTLPFLVGRTDKEDAVAKVDLNNHWDHALTAPV